MSKSYSIIKLGKKQGQSYKKTVFGYVKFYSCESTNRLKLVMLGRQVNKERNDRQIKNIFNTLMKAINKNYELEDLNFIYPSSRKSVYRKKAMIKKGEWTVKK